MIPGDAPYIGPRVPWYYWVCVLVLYLVSLSLGLVVGLMVLWVFFHLF